MSEPSGIGILALQGGVVEHRQHLAALGVAAREVRTVEGLAGLRGLILPGGESTCLGRLLKLTGLGPAIVRAFREDGLVVWGTCAGAILLADEVVGESPHLSLMPIAVARNAFGSQLDSFRTTAAVPAVAAAPIPLVFIRAPQIRRADPPARILLEIGGYIAAAETDQALATVFHPELSDDLSFHRHFLRKCGHRETLGPDRSRPFLAVS
ncbi:MAG: pyridoxal 5'-phosphate synthase glutaminase subunit PdxT [Lentisphaeria bacterium]|jgi:5'-phosphate synthase pdxT subunit|nr:pyridoxal 5'-phosphate synthase glutaminase subunit PdxT [Lentisphaeria bacterium]